MRRSLILLALLLVLFSILTVNVSIGESNPNLGVVNHSFQEKATPGEMINASITIENKVGNNESVQLSYVFNNETIETRNISLPPKDREENTFRHRIPREMEGGNYGQGFEIANESILGRLIIRENRTGVDVSRTNNKLDVQLPLTGLDVLAALLSIFFVLLFMELSRD